MTSRSTAMISLLSDSGNNSPVHLTAPNRNPNSSSRFSRPQWGSLGTLRPSHVLRCGTNPVSTFFLVLLFDPNIACHFFFFTFPEKCHKLGYRTPCSGKLQINLGHFGFFLCASNVEHIGKTCFSFSVRKTATQA